MEEAKPSISDEEVAKVVEAKLNSKKWKINDYSLEMLGQWVGNCGDHATLKITVTKDSKETPTDLNLFVKLYPRVESIVEFIEWTGSFKKEIFIYKLFDLILAQEINLLSDCVSKCYLSIPKKFLVLDNLALEGYTVMNKHEFFDYETVKVVLDALSKLHASTLIYEEKKSCRLLDIYEDDLEETYFNDRPDFPNKEGTQAAITGILNAIELFQFPEKLLSGKNFRSVLQEVCERVYTLARPSKTFRNVITHGDIWATNLLIKRDVTGTPLKCKLVDFQCGRYTPPAQDIMALIYLTTSREFRQKHMYNLIGGYYTSLEKHVTVAGYDMKKILPFENFLTSCEEQKVFGMVQTATYFPLILLKVEATQEFFREKEKNKVALFVDRSVLIREHMDKDENYRNRIRECIQDLKVYCDYV